MSDRTLRNRPNQKKHPIEKLLLKGISTQEKSQNNTFPQCTKDKNKQLELGELDLLTKNQFVLCKFWEKSLQAKKNQSLKTK